MGYFSRSISEQIRADLKKKMVLLSGPRQTGKTALAKSLLDEKQKEQYLNWDYDEDRERILKRQWSSQEGLIIFDEIHKYKSWRNLIKGLYDKHSNEMQILVTGSARLDYYRHGGDSLQGRYYAHHLFPLTVAELKIDSLDDFNQLLTLSGFPEPFFSASLDERNRWARTYRSLLIREDLRDLENISQIGKIELLAMQLPTMVASPLSLNNLREDLEVAHATVQNWCNILERLYYIFRICPFTSNKLRSIKKQSKHYHYDWALVKEPGAKLENLVAVHLLKWCTHQQDVYGKEITLSYFRDIDQREVDFVLLENGKPIKAIECKSKAKGIATSLKYFKKKYPNVEAIQTELEPKREYVSDDGIKVKSLISFLSELI